MKTELKIKNIAYQIPGFFIAFSFARFALAGVTLTGPDSFLYNDNNEELTVKIERYTRADALSAQHRGIIKQRDKIAEGNVYCDQFPFEEGVEISDVKVIKIRGLVAFIIKTTNNKYFLRFRFVQQILVTVHHGHAVSGQVPRIGIVYDGYVSGGAAALTSAEAFPQSQEVSDSVRSFYPTGNYHRQNIGIRETTYWYTVPIRLGIEWDAERNMINLPGVVEWRYETVDQ